MKRNEERYQAMIKMRHEGKTPSEIGAVFGVSRQRVEQIIGKYSKPTPKPGSHNTRATILYYLKKIEPKLNTKERSRITDAIILEKSREPYRGEVIIWVNEYIEKHMPHVQQIQPKNVTYGDIQEIKKMRKLGFSLREIGNRFGKSAQHIWSIVHGYERVVRRAENEDAI